MANSATLKRQHRQHIIGRDNSGTLIADFGDGPIYVTDCCYCVASVGEWGFFCKGCYGDCSPYCGGIPTAQDVRAARKNGTTIRRTK